MTWPHAFLFLVLCSLVSVGTELVAAPTAKVEPAAPAPEKAPAPLPPPPYVFREELEAARGELTEQMRATFRTLEDALSKIEAKSQNLQAEGNVLDALRALVKELHAQGQKVLDSQRAFVGSAGNFSAKLAEGPDRFRALAEEFRGFAAEESYAELAEDYRQAASSFEALAKRCEEQLLRIEPAVAEYRANLGFLERSLLFLTRLDKALSTVPDLAEFNRLEGTLTELSRYVKGFERLRGALREFDQALLGPRWSTVTTRVARTLPPRQVLGERVPNLHWQGSGLKP